MRWQWAALCCVGGLLASAGGLLAVLLVAGTGGPTLRAAWIAAAGGLAAATLIAAPLGFRTGRQIDGTLRRIVARLQAWADGPTADRLPPAPGALAHLAEACNAFANSVEERLRAQRRIADAEVEVLRQGTELAALRERNRIARDLHDAVSQRLFGIHLLAAAAARTATAPDALRELELRSREAQREMRALLLQLRPPALHRRPLADALAALCAEAEALPPTGAWSARHAAPHTAWDANQPAAPTRTAWHTDFGPLPALGPAVEDGLYRIAQEAITNVRHHARAHHATLTLHARDGHAWLAIDDDGRGFLPGSGGQRHGMGLAGMRERAALLGGVLHVQSQPGRGTRIEARVPVLEEPSPPDPDGGQIG